MTATSEAQIVSQHPYDPHFDERSKLDQEIGKLERHLHMLRVKRNALLPITILPIDILVEIFKLAVTQAEDGSVIPKRIAEISWVCRPWREVALGHPILWTDISHSLSPRWKKAYLERSKPADISIAIDYIFRRPTFLDTFVLESELPRIRHLEVYPGCLSTDELISTIPAPVLQSVKLHGVKIHNALFSGTAPHLTAVHLRGCAGFRFDTIAFPQLMELHLAGINPKPSIQAWLTGLSSLPNLQRLALKDALDSSVLSENALVSLPHVDLPNLQSISAKEYAPRSPS
ncbi:hypothetical protein BDN72DRAFT_864377 [Pluteus cervinus]|uniref:Uncharacterized protein n=1 Tax=Pluteus cervinus TaxID=181527 RepID=A0ACD3A403_9AGAR|nr:hypothetical protein BDN72DRAFT_864377 [Pluteus cervinus]